MHANSDLRWALGAAALAAKAMKQDQCGPRSRHDNPFGWLFGGGPGGPMPGPPGPWGRPPWAKGHPGRGPRAPKGNVRSAILALLAEEPRNGYQIIQEINERSRGAWKPSPGAVYPALQQLADEGLIRGEEDGGRKTFHLTDEGRAHVEAHADELADPWERMRPEFGEGVPDLFKQAAQTGAAIMQIVQAGSPDQMGRATEILADTRRRLYQVLADDDAPTTAEPEE
ncbi:PadR family transcriptional regulator [Spirillospora sp. CA-294931]|uniref:PadR family transcriptional regulator n=1 Tax=Spirillospora sp. CA-294931 TaxID=3240042 RepID=UPI003D89B80C